MGIHLFRFVAVLFALSALIALFPGFFDPMWRLRVLFTELGHWFGLAGLLIAVLSYRGVNDAVFYRLLLVSSLFLFRPVISAWWNFNGSVKDIPWRQLAWPKYRSLVVARTLPFEQGGVKLPIDLYSDPAKPKRGLVVVIHGGSWAKGSREDLPELNYQLADLGYAVAAVSYRFAPAFRYPAPVDDVLAAFQYLKEREKELGLSFSNVFFIGRSAGGQIAEIAAHEGAKKGIAVRGVVTLYAPADLVWGYNITRPYHIIDGHEVIGNYLNGSPLQVPKVYEAASPLYQVDKDSPPHLIIHGTWDELVAFHHARELTNKLVSLGRPVTLLELSWATHGFDFFPNGPGGLVAFTAIRNFLAEQTTGL